MEADEINWNDLSDADLREIISGFNPTEVFAKFADLAKPHIRSQSLFAALDDLPEHLGNLSTVSLPAQPTTLREVAQLAGMATPGREHLILPAFTSKPDQLNEIANRILIDQKRVTLLLAHQDITDIGRILPEVIIALSEYQADAQVGIAKRGMSAWNYAAEQAYQQIAGRTHVVLSGIIRPIGALGLPIGDLLRKVGWVHFSFPQTESVRRADFDPRLVRATNLLMRREISRELDANGGLLGIAAPGSVDKNVQVSLFNWVAKKMAPGLVERLNHTRHIQPVTKGTAEMVCGWVLPVATSVTDEQPFCETGRLQWAESLEDLHSIMHWIARKSFSRTLRPTFYHEDEKTLANLMRSVKR